MYFQLMVKSAYTSPARVAYTPAHIFYVWVNRANVLFKMLDTAFRIDFVRYATPFDSASPNSLAALPAAAIMLLWNNQIDLVWAGQVTNELE